MTSAAKFMALRLAAHRGETGGPCPSLRPTQASAIITDGITDGPAPAVASPGPPSGEAPPARLAVSGLEKSYGARPAVAAVSFELTPGITGLLGPNGAGKSTLLRCIAGISEWDRGSVTVDGVDATRHPRSARRRLGYMPERVAFPAEMAVGAYLAHVARLKALPRRERPGAVEAALERAGLVEVRRRLVGNLSKGYRQRVGLAQALLGDPPVAVLDEPMAGLDPLNLVEIRETLSDYARHRVVLVSTHILSDVRLMCDRVLVMSQGVLLHDGPTAVMATRAGPPGRLRIRLAGQDPDGMAAVAGGVPGVAVVRVAAPGDETSLVVEVSGGDVSPLLRAGLDAGWSVLAVEATTDQLEDAFRRAVGAGDVRP